MIKCLYSQIFSLWACAKLWYSSAVWYIYFKIFENSSHCLPQWLQQFLIPPRSEWGYPCTASCLTIVFGCFVDPYHCDCSAIKTQRFFDLHFLYCQKWWIFFETFLSYFDFFFWKLSVQNPNLLFKYVIFVLFLIFLSSVFIYPAY